jgi:hypothetical protein
MLASLVFFERLPAADFAILHPVKVVSLRDLHPAGTLRFPLVAGQGRRLGASHTALTFGCGAKIANRQ